ncbi:hypothetical protein AWRIB419_1466 [Oenococcus oeni AWRIB419]|nr:hypothetical protein AWRIB304_1124 [Oenococcus oeni AWRIB304]EJN99426.1 hypothetical protein AWRIB419_1466 [Oenococcus oeni AWRIB419]EJN99727.1 hypothetical protein AWRIB418_1451 [Oenococcus oeni AWRIB418]EJO01671.1 hypothetical protein AWRIB318_765 [Oenococcus oeni AWRIB318]EJO03796.1 hypothetical protein AWRIB422_1875 [Oenococcus oeni AWRIB422]EJO04768.1 hypothetical protein AWRIB553_1655 [Oenococcus oeni AWRIB553]EJO06382.1 hypothetical protein AWRIB548_708 [Oenococcus oeni AWRIB548]EJ
MLLQWHYWNLLIKLIILKAPNLSKVLKVSMLYGLKIKFEGFFIFNSFPLLKF